MGQTKQKNNMEKSSRGKILLNMQMSPLDYDQGVMLLQLICDLEDGKREDVILMLTYRYDMKVDRHLENIVKHKFEHVFWHITERKGNGWPAGPNAMMSDGYLAAINMQRRGIDIAAVMFIEFDCVPLVKDWIDQLKAEWDSCRKAGKSVLGPWLEAADAGDAAGKHINGNCIIAVDYWRKNRGILNSPENIGWDVYHANNMCAEGMASRLIYSDYRLGTAENPWKGDAYLWEAKGYGAVTNPLYGEKLFPVWLHGVKCLQGIKAARKKLLTSG